MIQIFAVRMNGGEDYLSIELVMWLNPATAAQGTNSRSEMVEWLRGEGRRAYVCDGRTIVSVGVVDGDPPYLRTYADRKWTNNLLSLPRF